ncbi:hypothetical protein HELRODRAFT_181678 [Helobdella robusta]|uniref:Ig-like domain-containing protein n=1 Tax=Helobdella robusta TaxID=6412 RepID=T1FH82_HELRO|nr:hypothetical protein HELRODRAFT_181678 [Helobdella robusta]ESN92208.1 hypothetical protein HELRODRAFT_181678 [Helobdella robusta]
MTSERVLLIVIFTLLCSAIAQTKRLRHHGPPYIKDPNMQLRVTELGKSIKLECPIETTPHHSTFIIWEKRIDTDNNDKRPMFHKETSSILSDSVYRAIKPSLIRDGLMLHVKKARLRDAGIYRCTIINGFGSASAQFRVVVVTFEDGRNVKMTGNEMTENSREAIALMITTTRTTMTNYITFAIGNDFNKSITADGEQQHRNLSLNTSLIDEPSSQSSSSSFRSPYSWSSSSSSWSSSSSSWSSSSWSSSSWSSSSITSGEQTSSSSSSPSSPSEATRVPSNINRMDIKWTLAIAFGFILLAGLFILSTYVINKRKGARGSVRLENDDVARNYFTALAAIYRPANKGNVFLQTTATMTMKSSHTIDNMQPRCHHVYRSTSDNEYRVVTTPRNPVRADYRHNSKGQLFDTNRQIPINRPISRFYQQNNPHNRFNFNSRINPQFHPNRQITNHPTHHVPVNQHIPNYVIPNYYKNPENFDAYFTNAISRPSSTFNSKKAKMAYTLKGFMSTLNNNHNFGSSSGGGSSSSSSSSSSDYAKIRDGDGYDYIEPVRSDFEYIRPRIFKPRGSFGDHINYNSHHHLNYNNHRNHYYNNVSYYNHQTSGDCHNYIDDRSKNLIGRQSYQSPYNKQEDEEADEGDDEEDEEADEGDDEEDEEADEGDDEEDEEADEGDDEEDEEADEGDDEEDVCY